MASEINRTAVLVYQQLLSLGVAPGTAAGAVGSLMGESGKGLNTAAINRGDGSDGSDSIGMGQWNQSRATALKSTAAGMGTPWTDARAQLRISATNYRVATGTFSRACWPLVTM